MKSELKSITFYVEVNHEIVWSHTRQGLKRPERTKLWRELPAIARSFGSNTYGCKYNYA